MLEKLSHLKTGEHQPTYNQGMSYKSFMQVPDTESLDKNQAIELAEFNIMSYKVLDKQWDHIDLQQLESIVFHDLSDSPKDDASIILTRVLQQIHYNQKAKRPQIILHFEKEVQPENENLNFLMQYVEDYFDLEGQDPKPIRNSRYSVNSSLDSEYLPDCQCLKGQKAKFFCFNEYQNCTDCPFYCIECQKVNQHNHDNRSLRRGVTSEVYSIYKEYQILSMIELKYEGMLKIVSWFFEHPNLQNENIQIQNRNDYQRILDDPIYKKYWKEDIEDQLLDLWQKIFKEIRSLAKEMNGIYDKNLRDQKLKREKQKLTNFQNLVSKLNYKGLYNDFKKAIEVCQQDIQNLYFNEELWANIFFEQFFQKFINECNEKPQQINQGNDEDKTIDEKLFDKEKKPEFESQDLNFQYEDIEYELDIDQKYTITQSYRTNQYFYDTTRKWILALPAACLQYFTTAEEIKKFFKAQLQAQKQKLEVKKKLGQDYLTNQEKMNALYAVLKRNSYRDIKFGQKFKLVTMELVQDYYLDNKDPSSYTFDLLVPTDYQVDLKIGAEINGYYLFEQNSGYYEEFKEQFCEQLLQNQKDVSLSQASSHDTSNKDKSRLNLDKDGHVKIQKSFQKLKVKDITELELKTSIVWELILKLDFYTQFIGEKSSRKIFSFLERVGERHLLTVFKDRADIVQHIFKTMENVIGEDQEQTQSKEVKLKKKPLFLPRKFFEQEKNNSKGNIGAIFTEEFSKRLTKVCLRKLQVELFSKYDYKLRNLAINLVTQNDESSFQVLSDKVDKQVQIDSKVKFKSNLGQGSELQTIIEEEQDEEVPENGFEQNQNSLMMNHQNLAPLDKYLQKKANFLKSRVQSFINEQVIQFPEKNIDVIIDELSINGLDYLQLVTKDQEQQQICQKYQTKQIFIKKIQQFINNLVKMDKNQEQMLRVFNKATLINDYNQSLHKQECENLNYMIEFLDNDEVNHRLSRFTNLKEALKYSGQVSIGQRKEDKRNCLDRIENTQFYSRYGQAVFDFQAMITASALETKLGKYEDNQRKQIGIKRLSQIIDHLQFSKNMQVNFKSRKYYKILCQYEQLQQEKLYQIIAEINKKPSELKLKEIRDLQSLIKEIKLKKEIFAIELQKEKEVFLQFIKQSKKESQTWIPVEIMNQRISHLHHFFGKLAFEYGNSFLFSFIRKQNIFNRDLKKIGGNLQKIIDQIETHFKSDPKYPVSQNYKNRMGEIQNQALLNISVQDQSIQAKDEKLQSLISYIEILGGYLYRLFLQRMFHEDLSLADYSFSKIDDLINYFDGINLPTLILAENGLYKSLYCDFPKEMQNKKDNFDALIRELNFIDFSPYNSNEAPRPWFQRLFDHTLVNSNSSLTDSSSNKEKSLPQMSYVTGTTQASQQGDLHGIQVKNFMQRILHFHKTSTEKVAKIIELMSFDHTYHKNFLFRILSAKYLDKRNLKECYEFFLNTLCEGRNNYSLKYAIRLRDVKDLQPKPQESYSKMYLHPMCLKLDWNYIVEFIQSKYYCKLFTPYYTQQVSSCVMITYSEMQYNEENQITGTYYLAYLGQFTIVKIKFPGDASLNVCKFFIHFFLECNSLFEFIEEKAKEKKLSIITEKEFFEQRKAYRDQHNI